MFLRRHRQSALRRLRIRLLPVPTHALGLAVLVAVLATALVSAPLMIASVEDGTWKQERERLSETAVGATLVSVSIAGRQQSSPDPITRAADLDEAVAAAADEAGLASPSFMARPRDPLSFRTGTSGGRVQLFHRTAAEDHVEIVAGSWSDEGVLAPQGLAEEAGIVPGDVLEVRSENDRTATLPVSGIYAEPTAPMPAYWEAYGYLLFLPLPDPITGDLVYPDPAILAPKELGLSTVSALREDLFMEWFLPAEPGIGVEDARAAAADFEGLQAGMAAPDSLISGLVTEEGYQRPMPRTALPEVLETVDRTTALLAPPVRAVGIGGAAAALVLVGAWAGQRMRRRDDELRSLVARGLSPARAAWEVVRESLLPVAGGLAAGGMAGWLIVRELGPSEHLPPGTLTNALIVLAAGGLAVLAVVAAVTAVLVTRLDQVGTGQAAHLLGRVPWLAVTAAVAVLATVPLVTGGQDAGGQVGVLTLMVPLLVTVVVAGAVTGLLPRIGRRADARLRRLRPGAFLAIRRVLAGHGTARLVVVTTALSLGLVVYAGALADGTDRTIEAKASVATGSDLVVPLPPADPAAGELPAGAMEVSRDKDTKLLPGDTEANVLVVHPDEVAGVVHWNDELAEQPLDDLMGALRNYRGDRVPVVLAGGPSAGVTAAAGDELTVDFGYYAVPVEVVARADAFPGQASLRPLVVADWDRYVAALEKENRDPELVMSREVWVRGEASEALDRLEAAGYAPRSFDDVDTRAEFAARPELKAQTWALAYLRAVAMAAGVLGLVGVVMHTLAQQRRRTVAALLLARMGMTRRASDAAVGLEIALLTGLAAVVAVAVAIPASALVLKLLDPVPTLRPEAVFATPWTSIAAVLGGVAVVTAVGAVLVGRSARRATGGQVMRDAS